MLFSLHTHTHVCEINRQSVKIVREWSFVKDPEIFIRPIYSEIHMKMIGSTQ